MYEVSTHNDREITRFIQKITDNVSECLTMESVVTTIPKLRTDKFRYVLTAF
jgi:hypothetical protein